MTMAPLNYSGRCGNRNLQAARGRFVKNRPFCFDHGPNIARKKFFYKNPPKLDLFFQALSMIPKMETCANGCILKINEQTSNYLCRMSEDLNIITGTKAEQYESLIPQIKGLLEGEPDVIANLANIAGALKEQFNWLWTGFYLVKPGFAKTSDKELVLGPFQGPIACTRIKKGKGVCGTSWEKAKTIIVPDVQKFPGHIACNSRSRSEIVVPVIRNNEVIAVLDADSEESNHFDEVDRIYLEKIMELIEF